MKLPRLLLTAGEPAGVGPDLIVWLAQQDWAAELIVIADPDVLSQRATLLGLPLAIHTIESASECKPHQANHLYVLPVKLATAVQVGVMNPANAAYIVETLRLAAELCLSKEADAIVTAPVNKSIINQAGIIFSGHTEFFAEQAGVKRTVMMFVIEETKIAIATTHLPLKKVPAAITADLLIETLGIMQDELRNKFGIPHPRIGVTGLNPHAGEAGYLGQEEIDIITPALNNLRSQNYDLIGPLSADTAFTPKHLHQCDAILAMYHDQALPVVKYMGFGNAVNLTLGLPFIRTSVDHGTAVDIAGTTRVDTGSMEAAVKLAIQLATVYILPTQNGHR